MADDLNETDEGSEDGGGTDWLGYGKTIVSPVLDFFGKNKGKDKAAPAPAPVRRDYEPTPNPINWKLWIGVGAGVLVAIVTLGLVFRKPSRSA